MIEKSGIPTVSVSVLREITDLVTPPRVLYQKRALGRILGDPHQRELQASIIRSALKLIPRADLPVSMEFVESVET